jgi:hypothetical protein
MPAARTALLLLTFAALALGIAACGGSEVDYEEVPGPPANVPIPNDTSALDAGSGDAGRDSDADADATPTPDPDTGTVPPEDQSGDTGTNTAAGTDTGTDTGATPAPAGTDTAPTDSGGTTAPAEPDSPTSDTPPPEGSEAQQFEDFCAENPGAC